MNDSKESANMKITNVEIKAKHSHLDSVRSLLSQRNAQFIGTDQQTDYYFRVSEGRLKLRQGLVENALIFYHRDNAATARPSHIQLVKVDAHTGAGILELLTSALGTSGVVKKSREIWFVDNVKIHLDTVEGLGTFIELEAIQEHGLTGDDLRKQVVELRDLFGITEGDLISLSYSDMV